MKKVLSIGTMLLLFCGTSAYSQVVKVIGGAVLTAMSDAYDIYEKQRTFYTGGIGVDYLEGRLFYLSSEITYKPRGGKALVEIATSPVDVTDEYVSTRVDYLNINTTARVKYAFSGLNLYAGVGPKIDIRLGVHNDVPVNVAGEDQPFPELQSSDLKSVVWGIKPEFGFFYDLNNFRIDVNAAWMIDFTRIGKNYSTDLHSRSFNATLGIGYRF